MLRNWGAMGIYEKFVTIKFHKAIVANRLSTSKKNTYAKFEHNRTSLNEPTKCIQFDDFQSLKILQGKGYVVFQKSKFI